MSFSKATAALFLAFNLTATYAQAAIVPDFIFPEQFVNKDKKVETVTQAESVESIVTQDNQPA